MLKNPLSVWMIVLSTLAGSAFAADPTLHQVYQAAESGQLEQAQTMMTQVLQAHPNSAKAHYVEAELLAKAGRLDTAATELATAQRLQPGLPFAKSQAVAALKSRFAAPQRMPFNAVGAPVQSSFPWGFLALGVGVLALLIWFVRSLTKTSKYPSMTGMNPVGMPGGMGQPYGSGVAPMGPMGGMGGMGAVGGGLGSGIVSGLATGAAVGAGMVAGQALVHHFMDGNNPANSVNPVPPGAGSWDAVPDNLGGNDFGIADNTSWDDSSDLNAGGDDWS
jgi:hypothetical protein